MNLSTLILHYESVKNKICKPNPKVQARLFVTVRPKDAYPWQKAVRIPLLMSLDPFNDLICEKEGCEKYCFCERLEELVHAAIDQAGACKEQHYEPEAFFDVDYDAKFKLI